jgi:hypothetical protein
MIGVISEIKEQPSSTARAREAESWQEQRQEQRGDEAKKRDGESERLLTAS